MQQRTVAALVVCLLALGFVRAQSNAATKQFLELTRAETEFRRSNFPEGATQLGDHRFNDRWYDNSDRQRQIEAAHAKHVLAQLAAIDTRQLSEQDALSHELLRRAYTFSVEIQAFPTHYVAINQMYGRHLQVPNVLMAMPRRTVADYEKILARLAALPATVRQWEQMLREGLAKGITPPQAAIGQLPDQIALQVAGDSPINAPLLGPFASIPNTIPTATADLLRERASVLFIDKLRPAYLAFHAFLKDTYVPGARRTGGFGDLPNGAAWYALELQRHTTTNRTARQLHEEAMRDIDRLTAAIKDVMTAVGFTGTIAEFREHLDKTLPPFASTGEVLREYRDIAKRVDPLLPQYFRLLPRTPFGIEPVPAFRGAAVASYSPPPADGSRPGIFYVPADPKANPRWRAVSTVLHEGSPGHHLQLALFAEQKDIPEFRRGASLTAFHEGWATYAGEHVGEEMGFYKDPYARFGHLVSQMIGAAGIAIDTGLHAFGWSREQALEFRLKHLGGERSAAEFAVNRFSVWPGQIVSYTVGAAVIQQLRQEIAASRGDTFDIREFHDVVLRDGPVPLDLLEQRVRAHYARRTR